MGNWYKVTKKIKGRLYDYWQKTERIGKRVKTYNRYIRPHGAPLDCELSSSSALLQDSNRYASLGNQRSQGDTADLGVPADRCRLTLPEDAMRVFNPALELHGEELRRHKQLREQQRREDERIQYGVRSVRVRRQKQAVRKSKRLTKGIKSENPFIAQPLKD